MPRNKTEVVMGRTYVTAPDGRSWSIEGDHSNDPAVLEAEFGPNASLPSLALREQGKAQNVMEGLTKQLGVDLGTQGILGLIDFGTGGTGSLPARIALKGGAGFLGTLGLDQAVNPDKAIMDSMGDAALNTILGGGLPALKGVKIGLPRIFGQGGRLAPGWGPFGLIANLLPTFGHESLDPMSTVVKKSLKEVLDEVPKPVTRGPKGRFLTQAQIDAANILYERAQRAVVKKQLKEAGIKNIPGLVGNSLVDILSSWDSNQ